MTDAVTTDLADAAHDVLREGMVLPRQGSAVSCGAASLLVSERLLQRMPLPAADDPVEAEDFRGAELARLGRTNNPWEAGVLRMPWPMALGTPPWGALAELRRVVREDRGSEPRYGMRLVRRSGPPGLAEALQGVGQHEPALLYVGSARIPRHVVAVAEDDRSRWVVYDPASGSVRCLDVDALATGRQRLAGWGVPWLVISPSASRP